MQHSQLRRLGESVKLFAHKNPATVEKTLSVLKLRGGVITNITPVYAVSDLNTGYFSTELTCPSEDCYLLVLFCGSPVVLRVGDPDIEFIFWADEGMEIPYTRYDEFGTLMNSGELDELQDGWYHRGPLDTVLGYIEVFGSPYIISVPYCDGSIRVTIQVVWSTRVHKRKFGVGTKKLIFKSNLRSQLSFKSLSVYKKFNYLLYTSTFKEKTLTQRFTKQCS